MVELVMAVEETFDLELPDAEAGKLVTPALLIDFILRQVPTTEASVCLSRRAFYALRRVLRRDFDCPRAEIRPDAPLEALIPRPNRRAAWRRTQAALEAKDWPELERPNWLVGGLALVLAAAAGGAWRLGLPGWIGALGVVFLWAGLLTLTKPLRTEFPSSCRTAGELARLLVAHAPALFAPRGRVWTREEVAETVRRLTIEHLGLKPQDYREDARFVEDFGAG